MLIRVCLMKVEFKDYKPVQFTDPSVLQDSCSADVDLLSL